MGEMNADKAQVEPTVTDRGFKHYAPAPSEYGGEVKVYESSAASGPHIWLSAVCPANLNDPSGASVEAVAHLTLDNATLLRDQLTHLIENHYQVEVGCTGGWLSGTCLDRDTPKGDHYCPACLLRIPPAAADPETTP